MFQFLVESIWKPNFFKHPAPEEVNRAATFEVRPDPRIIPWRPPHQLVQKIGRWHWSTSRSRTVCFLRGNQTANENKVRDFTNRNGTSPPGKAQCERNVNNTQWVIQDKCLWIYDQSLFVKSHSYSSICSRWRYVALNLGTKIYFQIFKLFKSVYSDLMSDCHFGWKYP